jgi:hypothetical protein
MLEDDERAMRIEVENIESGKTWMDSTYVQKCTGESQSPDTTGGDSGAVVIVDVVNTLPACVPAQVPCMIIMSENSEGEQLLPGRYRFRVTIWSNYDTISAENDKTIHDTVPANCGVQAFENCASQ